MRKKSKNQKKIPANPPDEKTGLKPLQEETQPTESAIDDQNPFDFGGLPKRDLKKNMGCG